MTPRNIEEKLIWYGISATYLVYLIGGLYLLAPLLGWVLLGIRLKRQTNNIQGHSVSSTLMAWVWSVGMIAMLIALMVAHASYGLDMAQTSKSVVGWAKGWALLALFVVAGTLEIRTELVVRASCFVGLQSLVALIICVFGYLAGLPEVLYVSPLNAVGGPGPEFFDVSLYAIEPDSGRPRFRLFTPWGPALGLIGCIYFFLAMIEQNRRWRYIGLIGSIVMVLASGSRLGIIAIPCVWGLCFVRKHIQQPKAILAAGIMFVVLGVLAQEIIALVEQAAELFHSARPESSRVRASLGHIAVDRWISEAPIWGHAIVERGPHLVEYMYIGSHHSWFGLLFVKGIVGVIALALPLTITSFVLIWLAGRDDIARAGLGIISILILYSFAENLEVLVYLFWPGLLLVGRYIAEQLSQPNSPPIADRNSSESSLHANLGSAFCSQRNVA